MRIVGARQIEATDRPGWRRTVTLAAAAALAVGAGACVGERERLDVPRLTLELVDTIARPGDPVLGRVRATDASGLIFVGVYACTRESTFRQRRDFIRVDSADFSFELPVDDEVPPNSPVRVLAVAIDNQQFTVDTSVVIYLRDGVTPPTEAPDDGEGLCNQATEARQAR